MPTLVVGGRRSALPRACWLALDNNAPEGALPTVALGTKNYLSVGNDEAGASLAGLYALVATCQANGVDPEAFLADVLVRVQSTPGGRIDDVAAHSWSTSPS